MEILPSKYQNPNGAELAWIEYGGDPTKTKPGVLFIHGHNFNGGTRTTYREKRSKLPPQVSSQLQFIMS